SACAWGLKSDEDHRVRRIRQPLRKMVLNSAASHHAARGDDDAGRLRLVDLLRLFCSLREVEALPLQRRAIARDQLFGCVAILLRVLQEYFYCLDCHWAVAIYGHAWRLPRFHQLLEHENELLRALNRKGGNNHATATFDRLANEVRQLGPRIIGWMTTVS